MKRLVVFLLLALSLGLVAQQNANADYWTTYPDSSEALVINRGGGYLDFLFIDWAFDWDALTTHSSPSGTSVFDNLGAGSVRGYWLDYLYSSGGFQYYDVYGTNNNFNWFWIGVYYLSL